MHSNTENTLNYSNINDSFFPTFHIWQSKATKTISNPTASSASPSSSWLEISTGILEQLRSKVSYLSLHSGMKNIIVGKTLILSYILLMFFFSYKYDHILLRWRIRGVYCSLVCFIQSQFIYFLCLYLTLNLYLRYLFKINILRNPLR